MSVSRAFKSFARHFSAKANMGITIESITAGDGVTFPKKVRSPEPPAYLFFLLILTCTVQGDTVSMHYVGTLASNGKKFDSSRDRGSPFVTQIGVGRVIQLWDEGVPQLSLGQKAYLKGTSDVCYGSQDVGNGLIPANSSLIFVRSPLVLVPCPRNPILTGPEKYRRRSSCSRLTKLICWTDQQA